MPVAAGGAQPALKVEQESATVVTTLFAVLTPAVSQFILFIGALDLLPRLPDQAAQHGGAAVSAIAKRA